MSAEQVQPLRWALAYSRAMGWATVPVWWPTSTGCACPKGAECPSPGKHPMTARGVHEATAAEGQLRAWWARAPQANVGIATGWGSPAVLDIDDPDALAALVDRFGPLPETATATTGREGGLHYYYAHPDPPADPDAPRAMVPSRTIIPGVDSRGVGGLIIAPPSLHRSGRRYAWAVSPRGMTLPEAPAFMCEQREPPAPPADMGQLAEGMSPYGRRALAGIIDDLAAAGEGQRNDTLNRCAYRLGRLRAHISPDCAAAALLAAAAGIGLSRKEAEGTLRSGYLAGVQAEQVGPGVAA